MSTTVPQPAQQPYPQPAVQSGTGQPATAPAAQQPYWQPAPPPPGSSAGARPASHGSFLHRWPAWAQNTALIVGAVAVLVVVFFAGYFTAHAVDGTRSPGFGTNQNFSPRQFGGNGFGGQSGNGFGGQTGTGSGGQTGDGS